MPENYYLGGFEELVLLAVMRRGDDAYGVSIAKDLEEYGRGTSSGAVGVTLIRLKNKGMLTKRTEPASALSNRCGHPKVLYTVTGAGIQALNQAESIRRYLRGEGFGYGGLA